jgi:hypothetical protein
MTRQLFDAIVALRPGARFAIRGGALEWLDTQQAQPTEAEITAKIAEMQQQDLFNQYQRAVEAHIESVAKSRGYTSSLSCASYATGTNNPVWAAEATAFIDWRNEVWKEVFVVFEAWKNGSPPPTIEALIASLPQITWPSE